MPETKLQKRVRDLEALQRRQQAVVEHDDETEDAPFTQWLKWLIWVPFALIVFALMYRYIDIERQASNYRKDVRKIETLLTQADREVLDSRLALQEQYREKSNDVDWFVFPPQGNDDMQIEPPNVPGLSDKPLIADYNKKVLDHNRNLTDTTRALREEQGAPAPDWAKVEQQLNDAQKLLDRLKQEHPVRYAEPNSALKALQQAVDTHRRALQTANIPPEENEDSAERDREILYHWRLALLSRLIGKQRFERDNH